ncbi:MAG: hypothetical protein HC772_03045 [Leptolyngbyaceae cyanobacterium CRU_2_3]|nr:hypothetical protein [Leptolyngbyaceae cyanobacterium CRU_2_3]
MNTNDAPLVAAPISNQTATEDSLFTLNISSNFTDLDVGDTLTYAVSGLPDGLSLDFSTGMITGAPSNKAVGASTVTITAKDSKGKTVTSGFVLSVANVNDDPTVTSPIGVQSVVVSVPFSLDITNHFRDIDTGDTLTYFATGLPTGVSIDGNTGKISGNPAAIGSATIRVTANDGNGGISSDDFELAVVANTAPTLGMPIADQVIVANNPYNFTVNPNAFKDTDPGDVLSLKASLENGSSLPSWLRFNAATRTFSGTPTSVNAGTVGIRVTATDRSGISVSDGFSLVVNAPANEGGSTSTNTTTITKTGSNAPTINAEDSTPIPIPGRTINGTKKGRSPNGHRR